MEWIETTGKSVAEAREVALDQLGVDESEAEFEVVQEPKPGLFGRTRGIARVRARVSPMTPRPKNERKRRPKKKSDGDTSEPGGESSEDNGKAGKAASVAGRSKDSGRSRQQDKKSTADNSDDRSARSSRGSDGEREGGSGRGAKGAPREQMDHDEQVRVVESFLTGLVSEFGLSATAETTFEDKDLSVNLAGDGLGVLVGPRLATLESIQEITRLALQREAEGREYGRVTVDVAGIRQIRRESLKGFVESAAEKAQSEESTVVFEDMSSADRKQVHDLASEIDGVKSVSEGEDPRRRVALMPN